MELKSDKKQEGRRRFLKIHYFSYSDQTTECFRLRIREEKTSFFAEMKRVEKLMSVI